MTALLIFAPAYLLGCWALYVSAMKSPIHLHEEGYPITAKIISFPRNGEALRFHHFQVHDASGSKLSVLADYNPSRGGNA
jgi:hypothetical protein